MILNGPNLNLLGKREPGVYGSRGFDDYLLHEVGFTIDGVVFNAGAYTHTSVALQDAIRAITTPVIEVHISNVHQREPFRHHSMISCACKGVICGFGLDSYRLAMEALMA